MYLEEMRSVADEFALDDNALRSTGFLFHNLCA